MSVTKTIAPDGSWGWLVVIGAIIINMSSRSLEPSFGLLFSDLLKELQVETTGAAFILSTMDAVINFSGLIVGPLVKRFTYRKVAIAGALFSSLGLLSTSVASSVTHILIGYSIISGTGVGLMIACTYVGLNLYFDKKKGQAFGLAMAGTAMGYMAMPQIVSFLLLRYNFEESLLIISALSLNSVVGSSLFQPIKWHLKKVVTVPSIKEDLILQIPEEKEACEQEELLNGKKDVEEKDQLGHARLLNVNKNNGKENCPGCINESKIAGRKYSVGLMGPTSKKTTSSVQKVKSMSDCTLHNVNTCGKHLHQTSSAAMLRKSSIVSNVSSMDFIGSAMHIAYEADEDKGLEMNFNKKVKNGNKKKNTFIRSTLSCCLSFLKILDLDLLGDMVYLNIVIGIALIMVADLHFRMIMPFYMIYMRYSTQDAASVLSAMATADILSRVIVPVILDRISVTGRSTLTVCCFLVVISRSLLAIQEDVLSFVIVAIINGFIRGATVINIPLVLSEYATKENFPSVLGLSMVVRGFFLFFLGPLGGYIRDYTNSYPVCIHSQSVLYLICGLAWSAEYFYKKQYICK